MRPLRIWAPWLLAIALGCAANGEILVQSVAGMATTSDRKILARGSAFEITGSGVGPAEQAAAEVPFPEELGGSAIELTAADGSQVFRALLVSAAADRLVAIVPSPVPEGEYRLKVIRGEDRSEEAIVTIAGSNFGFITNANASGGLVSGRLLVEEMPTEGMTYIHPAYPGVRVELDAAGLGPMDGSDYEYPEEVNRAEGAMVVVGNLEIPVEYLGRNGARPGFDKVVFTLPVEGLPDANCSVSLRLTLGDVSTLPVALPLAGGAGVLCPNTLGLTEEGLTTLSEGGSIIKAGFDVANGIVSTVLPGFSYESSGDGFSGGFVRYTAADVAVLMANAQVLKPYFDGGGCFVHDALVGPAGTYVDAGEVVTLTGPAWSAEVAESGPPAPHTYSATLASTIVGLPISLPSLGLPLTPGKFVVADKGGSVVGPFQAEVQMSPGFVWTNAGTVTDTVDRNSDLVFHWTGGGADDVMQALGVVTRPAPEDESRIVTRIFMCSGHGSDGQITVPASILRQMPVVPQVVVGGPGPSLFGTVILSQTSAPGQGEFTAPLVDGGTTQGAAFTFGYSHTKSPLMFP